MSKATELANQLEALDEGALTSMWAREGDKKVVAHLRALDASHRQLLEALEKIINAADSPEADGGEMWFAEAVYRPIDEARTAIAAAKEIQ